MAGPDHTATLESLRVARDTFKQGLLARNTIRGYRYDAAMFHCWCDAHQLNALPATTETVELYLTDLLVQGKKITTAHRRKCAIAHEHRAHNLPEPDIAELQLLLVGAQRIRGERPRQMLPITLSNLGEMSAHLSRLGSPKALRNRALLVLGFASALRRSNLAALDLADVEFCREGLVLEVRREKQDQTAKGRLVAIARGHGRHTDPVRVLRDWLRVRGDAAGPLFFRVSRHNYGARLDGGGIYRTVKACLVAIGIDPGQYGAHSLRAGAVTALGEADVGVLRIAAFSGQNVATVARYFRRSDLWKGNAAVSLGL